MFVWKNEAHKPQEIDEHNLTKLNQISTYWVYIFNTKKKKKQWSDLTSSLEWKYSQPPPFNFLYFRPVRWHIFSISRCMARWSTITRIAHFKLLKFPPSISVGILSSKCVVVYHHLSTLFRPSQLIIPCVMHYVCRIQSLWGRIKTYTKTAKAWATN